MDRTPPILILTCVIASMLLSQCLSPVEDSLVVPEAAVGPVPSIVDGDILIGGPFSHFTENRGQYGEGAGLLYTSGDGFSVAFGPGYVRYAVQGPGGTLSVFEVTFEGANEVEPIGVDPLGHRTDFFTGRDAEGWVTGVTSYQEVRYPMMYDRIDLEFRYSRGALKYEFVVAPGGDPSSIEMRYEGVEGLAVDEATGDLLVRTASGTIRDLAPFSYQPLPGVTEGVNSGYVLRDGRTVGFRVDGYDVDRPLVIDPGLVFSTFVGCSDRDNVNSMFVDRNGDIWVTGSAWKDDFPTTPGAYDTEFSGGEAIVVKMDANCSSLLYSTYIGGWSTEAGVDLHVDGSGLLYLVGVTGSDDFPVTADAYCATLQSATDFFILTLDVENSTMVHSTLFGGSSFEYVNDCHFDERGLVYLAGSTNSSDFPLTNGSFDTTYVGGYSDAFLTVYNLTSASLDYSTFLGDTGTDFIIAIHVEGAAVYMCGSTSSGRFPVTGGAFDTTYAGANDVFVCKLNISTSILEYSTYLGGPRLDEVYSLAVDELGRAYVGGNTHNPTFPTTEGAYDRTVDIWGDIFVLKLDATGSEVLNCTFLGVDSADYGGPIGLDEEGRVYVVGFTYSREFPVTEGCFDQTFEGKNEIVMARFDNNLSTLQYATYIGGEDEEWVNDLAVLGPGYVLITGSTRSADSFPTTPGAYRTELNGYWEDIYIMGMDVDPPTVIADGSHRNATTGDPFHINMTVEDNRGVSGVIVQYWFGTSAPDNMTCQLVAGTSSDGSWSTTIDVPGNSLEDLHYRVWVTDGGDNTVITDVTNIDVIDDDPPTFGEDTSPDVAETDLFYTFNVSVEDNIGVEAVWVEYWYGNGTRTNATMDLEGSMWETWMIVADTLEDLHYVIWSNDTTGNVNSTLERVVDVIDINGPQIINEGTGRTATTGDPFEFTLTAGDNVGLKGATLWYAFGEDELAPVEMGVLAAWPGGNVLYSLFIDVPSDFVGNITYRIEVEDLYGNVLITNTEYVRVVDNDLPQVIEDLSDTTATTGEIFLARIRVADNIGIQLVYVGKQVWTGSDLDEHGNGVYEQEMLIWDDHTGPWFSGVSVLDIAGNELRYQINTPDIVDNDPPEFRDVHVLEKALKGGMVDFSVRVWENVDLRNTSVYVEYSLGQGPLHNSSMVHNIGFFIIDCYLTIDVPRDVEGSLTYRFVVIDAAGNSNQTGERQAPLYNLPPVVSGLSTWNVTESTNAEFDMTSYITDINDDMFTIECSDDRIAVEGLVLKVWHDTMVPDRTVTLTVSDGEDEVKVNLTIHVSNVNDLPVIKEMFPVNGTKVIEGRKVELSVTFEDEDGDEVSVTWWDGDELLGLRSIGRRDEPGGGELHPCRHEGGGGGVVGVWVGLTRYRYLGGYILIDHDEETQRTSEMTIVLHQHVLCNTVQSVHDNGSCHVRHNGSQ
jgi:hypothetical protein